jgi:hypothetical protein
MERQQEAAIISKIVSYSSVVLLPVILGNLIYYANDIRAGREVKKRVRVAILLASYGLGHMVYTLCNHYTAMKQYEFALIWGTSIFTEQILKFVYLSFWDMIKQYFINWFKTFILHNNKNNNDD